QFRLRRHSCGSSPLKLFLTSFKARKIAAASMAPVRACPQGQHQLRPSWRIVIMQAPRAEILPIAPGAACVSPGRSRPRAGFPPRAASAAPQWIDTEYPAEVFAKATPPGHTCVARTAVGAGKLHPYCD